MIAWLTLRAWAALAWESYSRRYHPKSRRDQGVVHGGSITGRSWKAFNGLRTGARWKDQPDGYPRPWTCWHRLERGEEKESRCLSNQPSSPASRPKGPGTAVAGGQGVSLGGAVTSARPAEATPRAPDRSLREESAEKAWTEAPPSGQVQASLDGRKGFSPG